METSVDPADLVILGIEQSGLVLTPGQRECVRSFLGLPSQYQWLGFAWGRLRLMQRLFAVADPQGSAARQRDEEYVYHILRTQLLEDFLRAGAIDRRDQATRVLPENYALTVAGTSEWDSGAFVRFLVEFNQFLVVNGVAHLLIGVDCFLHSEAAWIDRLGHAATSQPASAPMASPTNAGEASGLAPAMTAAQSEPEQAPNGLDVEPSAGNETSEATYGETKTKGPGRPPHGKEHYAAVRQDMIDAMVYRLRNDKTKKLTYPEFVNELRSPSTGQRLTSHGKFPGLAKRMKKALGEDCSFSALRAEAQEIVDTERLTRPRARTVVYNRQQPA